MRCLKPAAVMGLSCALLAALAAPARSLDIKRSTLSNGAVLLVAEQHQLPMVSIAIAFDAGARRDPAGKAGLAALTAASLNQGTKDLPSAEFDQKVDFMGSSVGVGVDHDYATATMTSLSKYLDPTLHLLAQSLVNPGLHDADIARKQGDQIADIKASQEEPGYVAQVAFLKELFGDGPYGHPMNGDADSVGKLSATDVRNFYHDHYKTGSAVIAVAGDVNPESIKAKLEQELAGIPGHVAAQAMPPTPQVNAGIHLKVIDQNVAQANVIVGSGGIARSNPDYYKIQVMNYVLGGGGFASRLMKVVRSKNGLAYSVASVFRASKFPGGFMVVLQTKNSSANQALRMVLDQIDQMRKTPVSAAELESAKKYMVGSFPLRLDRQSEIAGFMLQIELEGLGLDYAQRYPKLIDAVTAADVQDVAREYLHPNALDIVAVANQAEAKISTQHFQVTMASR